MSGDSVKRGTGKYFVNHHIRGGGRVAARLGSARGQSILGVKMQEASKAIWHIYTQYVVCKCYSFSQHVWYFGDS